MTPAEKMALIKRHSFIDWTSLVGCKAKPRQLSRHQYIVSHISDVLSIWCPTKLRVPQITLRRWNNSSTIKRHPLGHLDRYEGIGSKTISLTALLDNYDLFHLTGLPVQPTVLDWEPIDHTRDRRTPRVETYTINDHRFVMEVADLYVMANKLGVQTKTRHNDTHEQLLVDFIVPKKARKSFKNLMIRCNNGLVEPCASN